MRYPSVAEADHLNNDIRPDAPGQSEAHVADSQGLSSSQVEITSY